MYEIVDFKIPTRVIMHFKEDEILAAQHGGRLVHYQVTIDPDPSWYSPCGEFVRFDSQTSEVHGWVEVDSVVVDSVLAEEVEVGEWKFANG